LSSHSRIAARVETIGSERGWVNGKDLFLFERIPLRKPCSRKPNFSEKTDGDDFFYGRKNVICGDGSIQIHIELLVEKNRDYNGKKGKEAIDCGEMKKKDSKLGVDESIICGKIVILD